MKRFVGSVLAVGTGAIGLVLTLPSAPAGAASFCGLSGFAPANTFVWTGATHDHSWQTAGNWTVNGGVTATRPPGSPYDPGGPNNLDDPSRDVDYVCIGVGASVTLGGADDDHIAGPAVAALDLGQSAKLTVTYASKLWINRAASANQPSTVRAGSTLTLQGATLGGKGTLSVSGTLDAVTIFDTVSTPTRAFPVTITTRYCDVTAAACSGATTSPGRVLVASSGLFVIDGAPADPYFGGINLEDSRYVDNFGILRLAAKGHIAADHGTTIKNESGATIDITNDRGIYEGRSRYGLANAKINNLGLLVKSAGTGTSVIGAAYKQGASGSVRVLSGSLTVGSSTTSAGVSTPQASVAAGGTFGLGSCAGTSSNGCTTYAVSSTSPQAATVTISAASATAQVTVATQTTQLPAGTLGQAVQFQTPNATPTQSQPNVFTILYDASVLGGKSAATITLQRAEDGSGSFSPIPDCLSDGSLPPNASSCVDRRAGSTRDVGGGDVVVVIRTLQNSRWIAR